MVYTVVYTDDPTFQAPTFIDTFTLIVINNYAVVGQSGGLLKRTISQLKYAVDALTNQATVKKRTKTDGDSTWSDWSDVGLGSDVEIANHTKIKTEGENVILEFYGGPNYYGKFLKLVGSGMTETHCAIGGIDTAADTYVGYSTRIGDYVRIPSNLQFSIDQIDNNILTITDGKKIWKLTVESTT